MATAYIERTVADALTASAEVGALVANRVYPLTLPQGGGMPAVVYQRVESSPNYTMQGYGSETVTLALSSFAGTYAEMKDLALAVRGVMTAMPFRAVVLKEADVCAEESELPHVRTEYLIQQTGGY